MEQITTTTARTALPAIPAHIIPQSEYVDMRDEIIDSIVRRNYGIFIDGASYWFEIEYDTGSEGEYMIRLTGSVLAERDYYRGGSDGPGYDERIGHIRLDSYECRLICESGDFESWPQVECGFDPQQIDGYEYDLGDYDMGPCDC